MNDTRQSLEAQLANVAESLRLITERKSEYVEATSIPLDLVKNERELLVRQDDLQRRLAQLAADAECPNRSLEPLDVAHAAFFFGRDDLIATLTAAVDNHVEAPRVPLHTRPPASPGAAPGEAQRRASP